MAKQQPDWTIYSSGAPYNFDINIKCHDQDNVFRGVSNRIIRYIDVAGEDPPPLAKKNLSLMHLNSPTDTLGYTGLVNTFNAYNFNPFLKLTPKHPNNASLMGTTFGVGNGVGVSLRNWLRSKGRVIWEYKAGKCRRLGSDARKAGYMLGAALYKEHSSNKYVGNLLDSSYVDELESRIFFIKDHRRQVFANVVDGIRDDLEEFNKLVLWIQTEFKITGPNPVTTDVDMYNKFFPAVLPPTLVELKNFSYFMCHNFLFFEFIERFAFCNAYRRMHQSSVYGLAGNVMLVGDNNISVNWHTKLTSLPFVNCYRDPAGYPGHIGKHGLIRFHRSCERHYTDTKGAEQTTKKKIDEMLFDLFPDAIPKAFNALYQCGSIPNSTKIDELKQDINYLD